MITKAHLSERERIGKWVVGETGKSSAVIANGGKRSMVWFGLITMTRGCLAMTTKKAFATFIMIIVMVALYVLHGRRLRPWVIRMDGTKRRRLLVSSSSMTLAITGG